MSLILQAQLNIAPIWCFGKNIGLDFTSTPPDTFTSAVNTGEGSAGATDEKGNIWLYTDGNKVYNRNHAMMPNGFGLTGSPSSSQAAIVLQHPSQRNARQFYVLTVPEYAGWPGFCYSIVDMTKDGGLGDVVQKNVPLYPGPVSEQMQPAMHSNGVDYWVVIKGYGNDSLFSYLIDSSGVHLKHRFKFGKGITNTIGVMRFNSDYSRFAYTCYDYTGYVEICDFNTTTGVISNPLLLNDLYDPYGVSFSPDGSKLYVGHLQTRKLNQYDLSTYNATSIIASKYLVASGFAFGQINKAYDGKYYEAVLLKTALSEIGNPNAAGAACNFTYDKVSTGGKVVVYGLPLFYIYPQPNASLDVKGKCLEDTFEFSTNLVTGKDVFTWELNTGSGFKTVSNNSFYKYKFSSPGTYYMRIINAPDTIRDTITVVRCSTDTLQWIITGDCMRDSVYFISNLKAGKDSCIWQMDEGAGYYVASKKIAFSKYFNTLTQFKVRLIGLNDTLEQTIVLQNCDTLQWRISGKCYEEGLSLWSNLQYGRDSILWQLDRGMGYSTVSRLSADKLRFDSAVSVRVRLIGFDDTLEQLVTLLDCGSSCDIKIPNVFTPNDDNLNDVFLYQTKCFLDKPELAIYNRWGEQLFESNTQGESWDGTYVSKMCPDGLYLYILSYDDSRGKRIMVNGLVHLIR